MSTKATPSEPDPLFPQSGWYPSFFWADLFEEEEQTFRSKIREREIRYSKWGNVWMVKAEFLTHYFDNQLGTDDGEEED